MNESVYLNMIYPTSYQWINMHTHRKERCSQEWVLRNAFHYPIDFESISYAVSMGIHPWWSADIEPNISLVERMQHPKVLAIGEIGLDRRCAVPFEVQLRCFEQQLKWACDLQKPVVIHAVKTYADMLPLMKKYPLTWIFHGFHGNHEIINQLLKFNTYFSLGTTFLAQHHNVLPPLERIFIETDTYPVDIQNYYERVAAIYQISKDSLQQQIFNHFKQIFIL